MSQASMRDMVIILPGIMGSVLTKHGKDLWSVSLGMAARALQREALVRDLSLQGDDPELPTLDDGVVATRVIHDAALLPGFWKVDGYNNLINNIAAAFGAKVGDPYNPAPDASVFPFPYDWRRDNRSSARRLERFVSQQLPVWRRNGGGPSAKVILIGHSMGGLVARYYLEVLGGHEHARGLYTFGTPHRGSLNALSSLVLGQKLAWIDVSPALRSFTAAYQLLPIYDVVDNNGSAANAAAIGNVGGLVQARAQAAIADFHEPIRAAALARADSDDDYRYTAIVGVQQPTNQSARLVNGQLSIGHGLPAVLLQRNFPEFGDGTVPLYAATPPGQKALTLQRIYVAEGHAALQNNPAMQRHLIQSMSLLASERALLQDGHFNVSVQPGLRLWLEDVYPPEGGEIRVEPADLPENPGELTVTITNLESGKKRRRKVPLKDGAWRIGIRRPVPGAYRIQVELAGAPRDVQPVHDLFEVAPAPVV